MGITVGEPGLVPEEMVIRMEMLVKYGVVKKHPNGLYDLTREGTKDAFRLYIETLTMGTNDKSMVEAAIEILKSRGLIEDAENEQGGFRITELGRMVYLTFLIENKDPDRPVAITAEMLR